MTKRRAPLTFERALTRVADSIGWEGAASICGQAPRTVRNWSEPDTSASLSLEAALRLDVAHVEKTGEDAPFLTCYAIRLDLARQAASPDSDELVRRVAIVGKEGGDAIAASLNAVQPHATVEQIDQAITETAEAISALQANIACLRARRSRLTDEHFSPELPRAPEVATINTA